MTKKNPRWRVEVTQLSEEHVPTWWERLLGEEGNPYAWCGDFRREGEDARWTQDSVFGYTKAEARSRAESRIAKFEAREKMKSTSREVFYVEGS